MNTDTDPNQDGTPPGNPPKADGTPPGGQPPKADKTYTQAEYDSAMGELRRKAERKLQRELETAKQTAIDAFLKEKGLDDAALSKLASGDDLVKAEQRAVRAEKKHAELEARVNQEIKKNRQQRAMSEVLKAAAAQRVNEPELLWPLLQSRISLDDDELIVLDDHGQPTEKTITEAVSEFLTNRTYLIAPTATGGANSRAAGGAGGAQKHNTLDPTVRKAALAGFFGK